MAPVEELFAMTFGAMFAVSGFAYALSIAQDPMASQLSMVMLVLVFVLFCGISPKLDAIDNMGPAAQYVSALSYGRWYVEALYTSQTRQLSDAWKMPWAWYRKPNQDCALAGLFSLNYSELYKTKHGHLKTINNLNIPVLIAIGVFLRVVSFLLLLLCNRDKMGKQTITMIVLEGIVNPISDIYDDLAFYYHAATSYAQRRSTAAPPRTRSTDRSTSLNASPSREAHV